MRKACILFFITLFILIASQPAGASETITVVVDGEKVDFPDTQPQIRDGRVLVPLRGTFETIGATVRWDENERTISSSKKEHLENMDVKMRINSPYVFKDYSYYTLIKSEHEQTVLKIDQSPIILGNRTMLPLRVSGESFGYNVSWESKSRTVKLSKTSSLQSKNDIFKEYPYLSSDEYEPKKAELDVFFLTNKERENVNKEPLALNADLSHVAAKKSLDLYENNYFDHTSPKYGTPFNMLEAFGFNYHLAGENIAAGQPTGSAVVQAWMDSPGHRENMLKSDFEEIGIGYVKKKDQYRTYWTQLFLTD
jgi:uncharacterized YkwD family protein